MRIIILPCITRTVQTTCYRCHINLPCRIPACRLAKQVFPSSTHPFTFSSAVDLQIRWFPCSHSHVFTSLRPQHGLLLFHGALRPHKPQGLWRWGKREIICCDLSLHCHHHIIYLSLHCHHQIIYLSLHCHHQIIYLSLHCHHQIIYLSLHCHHQNDSCINMGSDESHMNVSLIVRDKVTRQCPQTTTFLKRRESRSGIEPRPFCLPA